MVTPRMKLISGTAHRGLAERIAENLGTKLADVHVTAFPDGETFVKINENIRGADVFIIQPSCPPTNHNIMELLIMVDAARRASAGRINAVMPFFGYARQDRKAEGREPITARLVADLFKAAGASRMVSLDLHSGQIQGFFSGPVDHLTALPVLERYVRENAPQDLVIVSPDAGRVKVAERFAQHLSDLNADVAFINKRRPKGTTNVAIAKEVIGDVDGRLCILTDDMIDTGGTIVSAAELLLERGAKEVWAMATHGVLSDPAVERLSKSPISRVVLTNTLPLAPEKRFDKVEVLSVAKIIADALAAVFDETSVSELFDGENQS